MAYRKKARRSRKSSGYTKRKSYSGRKSGRSPGRVQTVRIQLVGPQAAPNVVQSTTGPMMPAAAPRRASF